MAHPDLNLLLNTVLPFAESMLRDYGEFFPFGATMSVSGEITHIGAPIKGDHQPPSQPLIEVMTKAFQDQAAKGLLRAAAICYDVRTVPPGETQKTDAICCDLEHSSGETVSVFVPYTKTTNGEIQYRELFAAQRTGVFFTARII